MASLIAEKDFIDFLFVMDDSNPDFKDLSNFINSEYFGYKLICDFENMEEYIEASKENPIWEMLMDKYSSVQFNPNINKEIHTDVFYDVLDEQNVFLISENEFNCDKLINERGYVFVSKDCVSRHWAKCRLARSNYKFKVTNDNIIPDQNRLDCWTKLSEFSSPLTSIIIFDKYILNDKTNQKLKDNLYKLLELFFVNNKIKKGIDLTIISDFKDDQDVINAYNNIDSFLALNNFTNVKLSIIKHDKAYYPSNFEGLHYRTIITNYFRFKCDDSFNFFKSNGKINNDAELNITFNLDIGNRPFYDKEIKDLKRYISKLQNFPPETQIPNKINYHKCKTNSLIN